MSSATEVSPPAVVGAGSQADPAAFDLYVSQAARDERYPAYNTLRKYIQQGRLPAIKARGRLKIRRADLEALDVQPVGPAADLGHDLVTWARSVAADAPPVPAHAVPGVVAIMLGGAAE